MSYNEQALSQLQNRQQYICQQVKRSQQNDQSQQFIPQQNIQSQNDLSQQYIPQQNFQLSRQQNLDSNESEVNFEQKDFKQQQYIPRQNFQSQQNIQLQQFIIPQPNYQTNDVIVENGIEYDKHGNLLSEEFDLGKDGSFNDFWILIGLFPYALARNWEELAKKSLEKKGFNVVVERLENNFIELLKEDKFDVVWLISGHIKNDSFDDKEFKNAVLNYHKTGKGLFIYGDNEPYFLHANIVLPELVGCSLQGNNVGNKTLSFGSTREKGQFDQEHLIFAGINNLYEGSTICYPDKDSKLTTLAVGTDGEPCILCCEKGQSNFNDGGRIVVDTGFTKLYRQYWASAGQARYVVNASVWLVDLEGRHGMSVDDFQNSS